MITRDLAAAMSDLLVAEAPANAVSGIMSWMFQLLHIGGQSSLDIVESEATKSEAASDAGSPTRAVYGKIAALARSAQHAFEAELDQRAS